jgi:MYXO-CTERM domain-containing protein
MMQRCKLVTATVFAIGWLACGPAMASAFYDELPVGYSDNLFQVGGGTSYLTIDITALGARDQTICAFCNSFYTDNYTVNVFNQTGALLESVNETNYLYYNMYSSSHGIGAGPVGITVPAGAATVEIVSRLSIGGLLGADGQSLSFGDLTISSDGPIVAATPVPPTLPLLATGLAALGLLGWHRRQKAAAAIVAV